MKINLSKKVLLSGVAALTAAGALLTSQCNQNKQSIKLDDDSENLSELLIVYADSSKYYDPSIKAAKENLLKARGAEIADSTECVKNPCRETIYKYKSSTHRVDTYKKLINFLENEKAKLVAKEINNEAAVKAYSDTLNVQK